MRNFEKKFKEELNKTKPDFADWAAEHAPQALASSSLATKKKRFSLRRLIPVLSACLVFAVLLPILSIFWLPSAVPVPPPSEEVDIPYLDNEIYIEIATLNQMSEYSDNLPLIEKIINTKFWATKLVKNNKPVFLTVKGEYDTVNKDYYFINLSIVKDRRYSFVESKDYANLKHSKTIGNRHVTYEMIGKVEGVFYNYLITYQENGMEYYYSINCFDESIDELLAILL